MLRRHRRGHAPDHGLDILSAGSPAAASTGGAHAGSTTTMVDEAELLAAPATADDLEAALAARPGRARLPRLTMMLAAAVLIGGGFLGGVQVGKHSASAGAGGLPAGLAAGSLPGFARGGLPSGGSPGGGGTPGGGSSATGASGLGGIGGGSGTFGTVKLVDGSTIYVQTVSGGIIRVTTSPSTKIQISASGQAKDLRPGQSVIVQGTKHGSGLVAATSVTQSGLGTGGG